MRTHLIEPRELRDLSTIDEAASWLRTTKNTLYCLRSRKQGPQAVKVGRQLLYPREALVAYVAEQAAKSA